jgi:hypothetical protein
MSEASSRARSGILQILSIWFLAGLLGFLASRLLGGCAFTPAPVPPEPVTDAGVEDSSSPPPPVDDCQAAEARLRLLGCLTEDGAPTWVGPPTTEHPRGEGFASLCKRAPSEEGIDYHPECLREIRACGERNAAARGECERKESLR